MIEWILIALWLIQLVSKLIEWINRWIDWSKDEETQVNGIVVIGNFANVGWTHWWNLDRNYLQLSINMVQVFYVAIIVIVLLNSGLWSSALSSSLGI